MTQKRLEKRRGWGMNRRGFLKVGALFLPGLFLPKLIKPGWKRIQALTPIDPPAILLTAYHPYYYGGSRLTFEDWFHPDMIVDEQLLYTGWKWSIPGTDRSDSVNVLTPPH